MAEKNKSFTDDAINQAVNEFMPGAVKWLLDKFPEEKYDEIFRDKEKIWNKVLSGTSFGILRFFNAPDVVDDITTEFFAEVRREIDRRGEEGETKNSPDKKDKKENKNDTVSIKVALLMIDLYDSQEVMRRVKSRLNNVQQELFLDFELTTPAVRAILSNLANCEEDEFVGYVDLITPVIIDRDNEKVNVYIELSKFPGLIVKMNTLSKWDNRKFISFLKSLTGEQLVKHLKYLDVVSRDDFDNHVNCVAQDNVYVEMGKVVVGHGKKIGGNIRSRLEKRQADLDELIEEGTDRLSIQKRKLAKLRGEL